jgi:hypothetical protein
VFAIFFFDIYLVEESDKTAIFDCNHISTFVARTGCSVTKLSQGGMTPRIYATDVLSLARAWGIRLRAVLKY